MKAKYTGKELIGREVMVHPNLTQDPYKMRGEIGKVIDVKNYRDGFIDILVSFKNNVEGMYEADSLFTLAPKALMMQGLLSNFDKLKASESKAILQVIKLTDHKDKSEALKLAMSTDTLQSYCVLNCASWISMKTEQKNKNNNNNRKGL